MGRVRVPVGSRIFSTPRRPNRILGPLSHQKITGGHSPGIKRPGREADHSPPSCAEVKNSGVGPRATNSTKINIVYQCF
jgi:hypothetical protein